MPDVPVRQPGTVLAFDFGVKRIGVAVGEWPLAQAHPLTTIHGEANAERFAAIEALLKEWRPVSLVVGLPVALDGSAHEMTARSTRFANQLRGRFGFPVDYAEERLSSSKPRSACAPAAITARSAREYVNALAAQIILQCFFERLSRESRNPAPSYRLTNSRTPKRSASNLPIESASNCSRTPSSSASIAAGCGSRTACASCSVCRAKSG